LAQLNIKLTEHQVNALREYAAQRSTPMAWLIKDYIDYLLRGGEPIMPAPEILPDELVELAQRGGAFDWLAEEPEIYSAADGEAV